MFRYEVVHCESFPLGAGKVEHQQGVSRGLGYIC
jgi:hypothetical protein